MFDKTENIVISVSDMHCNHCKGRVENTLKSLKGVKKFTVSLENANASVDYVAKKISPEEIVKVITESGFPASL